MTYLIVLAAVVALIGWRLRDHLSVRKIITASLAGPAVFYLMSNFALWLGGQLYPLTWAGLAGCYEAALPFFGNSLVAGVLFSGVLFGGYEFYRNKLSENEAHNPSSRFS